MVQKKSSVSPEGWTNESCLKLDKRTAESIIKVGKKKSLVDHEGWTSEYQGQKES